MARIFRVVLIFVVVVGIIGGVLFGCGIFSINAPTEYKTQYNCDYKVVSMDLDVGVVGTDGSRYNINGEIFSAYEDNLTMKNVDGEIVKVSNDDFNFISQNNHTIMTGDDVEYICDGKIKLFADSYDVYDSEENKVAYVSFNMIDTVGVMTDIDGNEIARYDSAVFGYDYVVTIFDGCEMDDESVLMIFASYVSDKRADNSN